MMPMIPLPQPSYRTGMPGSAGFSELCAAHKDAGSGASEGQQSQAEAHEAVSDPPLILIVDDDRGIRDSLGVVLDSEGLECLTAQNGSEAMELLRRMERQPDLILLDLMMPVMNGRDFRAAQLADPRLAAIPTLVLSAATDAASQATDLAVTGHLRKPINLDSLLDSIERLIPGWRSEDLVSPDTRDGNKSTAMNKRTTENEAHTSETLAHSEPSFKLLVDSVRDYAIYMLDPEGVVLSWNTGAERIKGYASDEIISRHFSAFYSPEDLAAARPERALREAVESGRYEEQGWRVRKDGSRFRAHVVVSPLYSPEGQLLGFAKITQDVTEQWETEQALRESEKRLRVLVEQVREYAIFMVDPQARILTWNLGAQRIKGYRADEVLGEPLSKFYTPEDQAAGRLQRLLRQAQERGSGHDIGWRVRKDGSRFWADVTLTALRTPSGELYGFAKVVRDLTERMEADAQRKAYEAAKEAIRLRDEFLSIAAHELRTPLTAAQLQLQGLRRLTRTDPAEWRHERIAAGVESAIASGNRLVGLVETLLDVSRIATNRIRLSLSEFNLTEACSEVIDHLGEVIQDSGCTIRLCAPPTVHGCWDRLRLEQALMNLISNACKYAPKSLITVGVEPLGEQVRLWVRDTGPGISEEHLERIFDRFERAVSSSQYGGLGLGLYVTRQIVEVHGGTVEVESAPGMGSAFCLLLPLRVAEQTARVDPGLPN